MSTLKTLEKKWIADRRTERINNNAHNTVLQLSAFKLSLNTDEKAYLGETGQPLLGRSNGAYGAHLKTLGNPSSYTRPLVDLFFELGVP